MSTGTPLPADPAALIRSRNYRVLLVLAALVGLIVSAAAWGFLELVHEIQVGVFEDLPGKVGYDSTPVWWPLPWVALAGLLTAFAIGRLPGRGGHVPADGLKTGGAPTRPVELPGVLAPNTSIGFASEWALLTGLSASLDSSLRIYQVDRVVPAPAVSGSMRVAEEADRNSCIRQSIHSSDSSKRKCTEDRSETNTESHIR